MFEKLDQTIDNYKCFNNIFITENNHKKTFEKVDQTFLKWTTHLINLTIFSHGSYSKKVHGKNLLTVIVKLQMFGHLKKLTKTFF